jgi:putative endonuclease
MNSNDFNLTDFSSNYEKKNTRNMGSIGEKLATQHLVKKGYKLISQNFTVQGGEIDLIMEKDGILVFVEVKTRWQNFFGEACEAMTQHKKNTLLRTIFMYMQKNNVHMPWRGDFVGIDFFTQTKASLTHYLNIFEF